MRRQIIASNPINWMISDLRPGKGPIEQRSAHMPGARLESLRGGGCDMSVSLGSVRLVHRLESSAVASLAAWLTQQAAEGGE